MPPRRSHTLADLMGFVVAVGVSLGCLTLYSRIDPIDFSARNITLMPDLMTAATSFLVPISLSLGAIAMLKTPRRRWPYHPAVMVGVSIVAAAFESSFGFAKLLYHASVITADNLSLAFTYWVDHLRGIVVIPLIAFVLVAALGGRLSLPRDLIEWAAVCSGISWIVLWSSRYWPPFF
ncbi:hypothetical protein [Paludisphaera rhizosphaerae]|uniref:hypothetical protein n=1 Tax=Paludisphaera rhizosphaerae TaxID=2711216 RepID=UPI0013EB0E89|nr:hypothetical protein [Paludisphaera rhizosphaerae]